MVHGTFITVSIIHDCIKCTVHRHTCAVTLLSTLYGSINILIIIDLLHNYFILTKICCDNNSLPKLFKLCPWGQNWPRPGGHNFTLIYKENFKRHLLVNHWWEFDQTSQEWSLGGPLPLLIIVQMVLIGCINRSQGQ